MLPVEDPIPGISGKMLAETIQRTTGQDVSYMSGFESIKTTLWGSCSRR